MSVTHEKLVSWYLRLNGYFVVDNFVVHAADDPNRISRGIIAPHTETDALAIRMPHSSEIAGSLCIVNHTPLVDQQNGRYDVVIAEAKSGNSNTPNPVWRNRILEPIEYVVRFIGLCESEDEIHQISSRLASDYHYEDNRVRFRYILFAEEPNRHYLDQGVTFITYLQIVQLLVEVRGSCWIDSGIGVSSIHHQWDDLINQIFTVANNFAISEDERIAQIMTMLQR
ncbi:hypothetical protein KKB18_10540 [bacterium]|nr:hypothetical protein [bacterium]